MGITLKYVTKSQELLKYLQKVYFCSTENDRKKYFDEISSDLFELQRNISIWYTDEDITQLNDQELQDHLADLSSMTLFVVPVSEEFLKTDNGARLKEFTYALNNNIPILPLLEEQGLEMLFNDVCGNLQILNKYDPDPTALPYKEKLRLFLDIVLLKDEMIEKIRQAFAAYIFLSYRKKDRRYAQEVMRLIHKDPFTRDIAIWYDEFLTPGEDFNESIRDAFEKSDLFSMVVTPNLLEKPNYVMTTEYPMALKANKKILPILAAKTDRSALKEEYPGIPEPIEADKDKNDLIGELIKEALSVSPKDDPQHKFFIGLAYLNGIDMETDHEKAISLITDAAEGGIEEAYQKLVSIYELGQVTGHDYEQAALWQEKYAAYLKKKLDDNDPDEDLRCRYIRTVNAGAAKWHNLLRFDRCWGMLEEMLALDTEGMTVKEKTALTESFQYAAEFANRQNDFNRARAFLDRMLAISEEFIASFKESELEKTNRTRHSDFLKTIYRGSAMNILGDIEVKEGNWSEA
ncbi:MAG: toll/interleukin-1 receptor domain-containing protein, partial [Erysipelotrichaceae bacterium]|nr:toll/interleukin-1 receptor domain-containing protein [Erysipelotrichaceae bacterium]